MRDISQLLFTDLKSDEEKSAFFLSGRAYETGVVASIIQNELAMVYHRVAELKKELAEAQRDSERLDWLDKYCTGASDSERYLPRKVYWGGGTHRDVRAAIDAAKGESNA